MSLNQSLLETLKSADLVCKDCGTKYGKYSVGCSSSWVGVCHVCGETKSVTEVRDYGYLSKGIQAESIKQQSKGVADYMLTLDKPIMTDEELEDVLEEEKASYEKGEITLKLTEDEVEFLSNCLDIIGAHQDLGSAEEVKAFEDLVTKVTDLFEDYCVKYSISPALKAYYEKYGTWGSGSPEEEKRWEGFRDAFVMMYQGES